jgi:hypothetical protein
MTDDQLERYGKGRGVHGQAGRSRDLARATQRGARGVEAPPRQGRPLGESSIQISREMPIPATWPDKRAIVRSACAGLERIVRHSENGATPCCAALTAIDCRCPCARVESLALLQRLDKNNAVRPERRRPQRTNRRGSQHESDPASKPAGRQGLRPARTSSRGGSRVEPSQWVSGRIVYSSKNGYCWRRGAELDACPPLDGAVVNV